MELLIVFYSIFIIYVGLLIWYIVQQVHRYRTEKRSYQTIELRQNIQFVIRNLMLMSVGMLMIGTFVTYKIDFNIQTNEPWQIGVGLASATFVFYTLFLIWDILKHRIIYFFQTKYQIELANGTLFNGLIILIITSNAIILLEAIMSIINMVTYLRS